MRALCILLYNLLLILRDDIGEPHLHHLCVTLEKLFTLLCLIFLTFRMRVIIKIIPPSGLLGGLKLIINIKPLKYNLSMVFILLQSLQNPNFIELTYKCCLTYLTLLNI